MAPAAAPPAAPMPTFLARLRLELLRLFLRFLVWLWEVAAIRGTAVSDSNPAAKTAATSVFRIISPLHLARDAPPQVGRLGKTSTRPTRDGSIFHVRMS